VLRGRDAGTVVVHATSLPEVVPMGIPPPSTAELRHRALGHRSRVELLARLRASDDGEDAGSLAAAMGLHTNTVRGHLRVLQEAGLVAASPDRRRRPGRPRLRFVALHDERASPDGAAYQSLASLLAETLAEAASEPTESAVRTGERLGRTLAAAEPGARSDAADGVVGYGVSDRGGSDGQTIRVAAMALLERLGFAPRPLEGDAARLELLACPVLSVARERREVVCALHLGILRGALAVHGADPDAVELEPFATPSSCLVSLPT
jgi:predicted ArsR family transcriptional regulator